MPSVKEAISKLTGIFTFTRASGSAYPKSNVVAETPVVPLQDVMKLYERDPTCKASVDLLTAAAVGMGFYTTANEEYPRGKEAKDIVDQFNEEVNLDGLLNNMARFLIGCGNDFWLKINPQNLKDLHRLPIDAIKNVKQSYVSDGLKIPYRTQSFPLDHRYIGGNVQSRELKGEAVIHWHLNTLGKSGFGIGLLQVLLHTLTIKSNKRPAYAWMKSKLEWIMPKIFEKYAGPDVLAVLEKANEDTIQKFERAIKNRSEEGAWLFYSGKGDIKPVQLDPRARFESYVEHIINQFYLGMETPLPRLFSTPGFTEASAKAALELQEMIIKPVQRYIKRQVEREIFQIVLRQRGFDSVKAQVRLNWGSPETPEVNIADMLKAAELGLIRMEEFRKNAAKFGWELWQPKEGEASKSPV